MGSFPAHGWVHLDPRADSPEDLGVRAPLQRVRAREAESRSHQRRESGFFHLREPLAGETSQAELVPVQAGVPGRGAVCAHRNLAVPEARESWGSEGLGGLELNSLCRFSWRGTTWPGAPRVAECGARGGDAGDRAAAGAGGSRQAGGAGGRKPKPWRGRTGFSLRAGFGAVGLGAPAPDAERRLRGRPRSVNWAGRSLSYRFRLSQGRFLLPTGV